MGTIYKTGVTLSDFSQTARQYFNGKSVALTGGSGFIGSHVVEQLLLLGARPTVLSRQSRPRFLEAVIPQIKLKNVDLLRFDDVRKALDGAEIVMSIAASVAGIEYNAKHPATIFEDNLLTFIHTLKAARENGVSRFLTTSSACVYPRHCSIPTPESEGMRDEPEPTNSGYGWSKRMEEYLSAKAAQEFGLEVAIARPYNAYGPRDNFDPKSSHVIPALIRKAFESKDGVLPVWGAGDHSRSFLYVDDFARGLIETAACYPKADPVNIGAEEEITIKDLALEICEQVGQVRESKLVPRFETSGITGQPRRKCDGTKAVREFGYSAKVAFRDGLRKTIQWYAHENRTLHSR